MPSGPPVFSIRVRNFALITHSVPAERVRARLPDVYELETFDMAGRETAFVTATCFCNEDFRLAGIGRPRHTFNETTYRTYVAHKGRRGVYFFGRYLGTQLARTAQRSLARDTYLGDFSVQTTLGADGYESYDCHVSSDSGETSFSVDALTRPKAKPPFASGDEQSQFLTYRLHGFFTTSVGREGHMPVSHPPMDPFEGTLASGRFDLWSALGIVPREEAADPYSVLVVPDVPFALHAPRPIA